VISNPAIARPTIAVCISAWENPETAIWKSVGPPQQQTLEKLQANQLVVHPEGSARR